MNLNLKKLLCLGIFFLLVIILVFLVVKNFRQEELNILDVQSVELYYRYSLDKIEINAKEIQNIAESYNTCETFEKVYSEELPCYSVTIELKNGSKLVFVDLHSDDSILVEQFFFGKMTKYELHDKELVQGVKKLIEDNYALHENEVCKKY